jgi:hypothetical protein
MASTQQEALWSEHSTELDKAPQSRHTPLGWLGSYISQYFPEVPEQLQAKSEAG